MVKISILSLNQSQSKYSHEKNQWNNDQMKNIVRSFFFSRAIFFYLSFIGSHEKNNVLFLEIRGFCLSYNEIIKFSVQHHCL